MDFEKDVDPYTIPSTEIAYIQNKIFGKEEFPMIDKNTFNHTQIKLEEIFKNFKEWLQHQIQ